MDELFGVLVLIGLVVVAWELRRKGQRRAVRVWRWSAVAIGPLALVVIGLGVADHDLAGTLRGVLTFVVALATVAATLAGRSDERS